MCFFFFFCEFFFFFFLIFFFFFFFFFVGGGGGGWCFCWLTNECTAVYTYIFTVIFMLNRGWVQQCTHPLFQKKKREFGFTIGFQKKKKKRINFFLTHTHTHTSYTCRDFFSWQNFISVTSSSLSLFLSLSLPAQRWHLPCQSWTNDNKYVIIYFHLLHFNHIWMYVICWNVYVSHQTQFRCLKKKNQCR